MAKCTELLFWFQRMDDKDCSGKEVIDSEVMLHDTSNFHLLVMFYPRKRLGFIMRKINNSYSQDSTYPQNHQVVSNLGKKQQSGRNVPVAGNSEDTQHVGSTEIFGAPRVVRVLRVLRDAGISPLSRIFRRKN